MTIADRYLSIILVFAFTTYATSNILGSPGKVYELLTEAANRHPVDGNANGSYLTMQSRGGVIFFVINIVGNFGTVFCDNGYYNKAIAAHPASALPGYLMGGLSWFAIPWLCATTMGLAAIALETNPDFPTYPNRMSDSGVYLLTNAMFFITDWLQILEMVWFFQMLLWYFLAKAAQRVLCYSCSWP